MSEHAVMPLSDYQAACDTIRRMAPGFYDTIKFKSGQLEDAIENVHVCGYTVGHEEGVEMGKEQGKQAEREAFWDSYQNKGEPNLATQYCCDSFFAGKGWNNETFKPKYSMKPTRAQYMFSMTAIQGDLVELCEKQGITIDFSNCTLFSSLMANASGITRIGEINMKKATSINAMFTNASELVTIDKLIYATSTPCVATIFSGCSQLTNLTVEGVIANNGFNTKYCTKLSKASHISIINCLSDDTAGLSVTLSLEAVKKAFETSSGANDGNTSEEWLNLIATKPNWTINLV